MTEERKVRIRQVFDALAPGYDRLKFVQVTLERLVEVAPLEPDMLVLDVATGTGLAAIAAAEKVGPGGAVIGIDLSPEMVDVARGNVARADLSNVQVMVGDAERLEYLDASFDAVICASSLFLIPNMDQAVAEWRRVLREGGVAAFSAFGEGLLRPLNQFWDAGLDRIGARSTTPPQRLSEANSCLSILEAAGFTDVRVMTERLDYEVASVEEWWEEMAASMDGMVLRTLTADQVSRFQTEVMAEVARYGATNGLTVEVPVHLVVGVKPRQT